MKRLAQVLLLFAALMMPSLSARGDEFYESRLRDGESAYREKKPTQAVVSLQIAAFGLMERPTLLSEALAYLALAQAAAGDGVASDATLGRFLEVERRFAPYAKLQLDATVAAEFQLLLRRRVAQATLLSFPGLAGVVLTEEQRLAKLPPRERTKAYEAAMRREPGNPRWPLALARDASAANDPKGVVEWTGKALEVEPGNVEARSLRAHARTARGEWTLAWADINALPPAELESRPDLAADRFVVLVELKQWAPAREAAARLTVADGTRPDVARARQRLAAAP